MIKRIVSKPQLFYLALLSFSISLGFTFQLSNLSSIFKFLGANGEDLPLLWLAPPLTGLLVQPVIGQISDDTISRWGKRRPYIIWWGILASLAFIALPLAQSLTYALLLTWIVDCSLNGSAEGLRALTGDLVYREEERSRAFAIQAFFAGIGGALGTALPYFIHKAFIFLNIKNPIIAGTIPLNLKISFVITAVILVVTMALVMRKVKERPYTHEMLLMRKRKPIKVSTRILKTFRDLFISIKKMPPRFKTICMIHGTTWLGIFIFWLYFTVVIAQNIYHLPIHADTTGNDHFAKLLQKATLDSSFYQTIYQYVSIGYALVLYFLSANSSKLKLMHAASLFVGGIGLALIAFETTPFTILLSICAIGIMWGSMLVLPYAIAMQMLPKGKIGTYLGIFNISITAPQILCGLLLSPIYTYIFQGHARYLLMLAGLFIVISAFFWISHDRAPAPAKVNDSNDNPALANASVTSK